MAGLNLEGKFLAGGKLFWEKIKNGLRCAEHAVSLPTCTDL